MIATDSFDRPDTTMAAGLGVADTGQSWLRQADIGLRIVSNKAGPAQGGTQIDVVDTGQPLGQIEGRMSGLAGFASQGAIGLLAHYGNTDSYVGVMTYSFVDYVELIIRSDFGMTLWSGTIAGSTNGSRMMGVRINGPDPATQAQDWAVSLLVDGAVQTTVNTPEFLYPGNKFGLFSTANSVGRLDDVRIETWPYGQSGPTPPLPTARAYAHQARARFAGPR